MWKYGSLASWTGGLFKIYFYFILITLWHRVYTFSDRKIFVGWADFKIFPYKYFLIWGRSFPGRAGCYPTKFNIPKSDTKMCHESVHHQSFIFSHFTLLVRWHLFLNVRFRRRIHRSSTTFWENRSHHDVWRIKVWIVTGTLSVFITKTVNYVHLGPHHHHDNQGALIFSYL